MIPDVEERSHIERYVGSSIIVKSHGGYGKQQQSQQQQQQQNYRQFQSSSSSRYAKFANDAANAKNNENRSSEAAGPGQRLPFSPKAGPPSRNADSRANCWSGYPLITFNAGRRENANQNVDQPRHYYANGGGGGGGVNTLKSYGNVKPSKCVASYSDFVTNKQGVPLIQANSNKFADKQNWERESRNFHYKNHAVDSLLSSSASSYCSGKPSTIESRENHRKNECVSDENLANSENCLPRIIKPRKRRKKDRKPNATFASSPPNVPTQTKKLPDKNGVDKSADSSPLLHNVHLTLYRPNKSKPLTLYQDGNVNDLLISRSLVNLFSEDSSQLLFADELRFDSLFAKESSDGGGGQTTFCNCRYCDPEGVVWDIRQRCFSPNLMPPVNGVLTASSAKLAKNKDWSTTLKRSCSEPASKPNSTPIVSRVRALSDSYDTTNQNLQVSSEIVTSLNGHRDIEIKFFSSSTPTSKM